MAEWRERKIVSAHPFGNQGVGVPRDLTLMEAEASDGGILRASLSRDPNTGQKLIEIGWISPHVEDPDAEALPARLPTFLEILEAVRALPADRGTLWGWLFTADKDPTPPPKANATVFIIVEVGHVPGRHPRIVRG